MAGAARWVRVLDCAKKVERSVGGRGGHPDSGSDHAGSAVVNIQEVDEQRNRRAVGTISAEELEKRGWRPVFCPRLTQLYFHRPLS